MILSQSLARSRQAKVRSYIYSRSTALTSPLGTLLNRLFGTDFDVMDETRRQQTTKGRLYLSCLDGSGPNDISGIWMCRGKGMNVMVMDVEGTDGRERGEDQVRLLDCPLYEYTNGSAMCYQDFERKSALFSLASSEVLIVNLWEHQVGLYQGANMGLLKTVFEVNLGLFGKKTADGYANAMRRLEENI
jgi:protein SEY1